MAWVDSVRDEYCRTTIYLSLPSPCPFLVYICVHFAEHIMLKRDVRSFRVTYERNEYYDAALSDAFIPKIGLSSFATASAVVNSIPSQVNSINIIEHMNNDSPPLKTVLPNLIYVPLQKPLTPSSCKILIKASTVVVALAA